MPASAPGAGELAPGPWLADTSAWARADPAPLRSAGFRAEQKQRVNSRASDEITPSVGEHRAGPKLRTVVLPSMSRPLPRGVWKRLTVGLDDLGQLLPFQRHPNGSNQNLEIDEQGPFPQVGYV